MRQYIVKRLILAVPTIIGVSLVVFFLVRLIPGDVVQQIAGDTAPTPEDRARIERDLGLDEPAWKQYFVWAGNAVRLDFGNSLRDKSSITGRLKDTLPTTFEMAFLALGVSLLIAIPVGVISATRQDSSVDFLGRSISIAFIAIPTFWLGTMIIVYASVWFTAATPPPQQYAPIWEDPYANLKYLVFPFGYFIPLGPAVLLGVTLSGTVMRLMRTQMLEVLRQDYVRTAWAKGLRERVVVGRHALKNALIPVVTVIGLQIPILIGGSVVIESIYSVPGMGRYLIQSIGTRDYTVVQAITVVIAIAVILSNLIVDILYAYLDPRIRYG